MLKSKAMYVIAVILFIAALVFGIVAGIIFPTVTEGYFRDEAFNVGFAFAIWVSGAFSGILFLFCGTILSHLEKFREFNLALIEELREMFEYVTDQNENNEKEKIEAK